MKQRKYFDCYGTVGRRRAPEKEFPYDVDTLLEDMAYARVHGAAVIHNIARDCSYGYGNNEAIKLSKEYERLYSLAVVSTSADYETRNKNYFSELLDNGVRGFVVFPRVRFTGSLEPRSMKKIITPLLEHNKPLIVSDVIFEDVYGKVEKLADEYPELPIIMKGTKWVTNPLFLEMMEKHSNLHYEISQNHGNEIIELTKEYFGIERALYSSEWPLRSMGAIKSIVEYADISEADKDLIAHGNACRLFGISPDELELYNDNDCKLDEIAKEMDEGRPVSVPVIDAHTHVMDDKYGFNNNLVIGGDSDSMIKKMDRLGIDAAITSPFIGLCMGSIDGNEETISVVKKHPGRFLGFGCCNVNYKEDLETVIQYHEKYPDIFVGIKPYPPFNEFALTDDICKEWFEYANEHHLMALIHADTSDYAEQTDILSDRYPNITFILAHSGANYSVARTNTAIAKKHDNVVLDITYTNTGRGMIEFLVDEVGADKVLYGSDTSMRDSAPQLGWVCYAKLSVEDKKKILAGNIERIMNKRK